MEDGLEENLRAGQRIGLPSTFTSAIYAMLRRRLVLNMLPFPLPMLEACWRRDVRCRLNSPVLLNVFGASRCLCLLGRSTYMARGCSSARVSAATYVCIFDYAWVFKSCLARRERDGRVTDCTSQPGTDQIKIQET